MDWLILIGLFAAVFDKAMGDRRVPSESTTLFHTVPFRVQRRTSSSPEIYSTTKATSDLSLAFPTESFHSGTSAVENDFSIDVEATLKTMLEFCHTCQKVTETSVIGNDCCMPCDCSDRCYTAGTCCVDITNGSRHNPHSDSSIPIAEETCVDTFVTGLHNNIQDSSYLLFQSCTDHKNYQTEGKCLHPDVSKLDEMTPVFNKKTNRHYRNVFCSKCNSEADNIVFWNTGMKCKSSNNSSSGFPKLSRVDKFSIMEFISTNPSCSLFWDPPSNVRKVDRCLSEQNIVSDCNKPILNILCKQYYAPVKGGSIIYRNVFCMECANPSKFTGIYGECYPYIFGFDEVPFISILSLGIGEEIISVSEMSDTNICPSPKRYNNKLELCIHHTCAVTEMNVVDVCKQVYSQLMNIHLEYRIKLRILSADIWDILPSILTGRDLLAVVGLSEFTSNLCIADILDISLSTEFPEVKAVYIKSVNFINIQQFQQSYHDYENNIEAYNKMAKETNSAFLLEIDKSDFEPMPEDSVTFVKFSGLNLTINCPNTIAMTNLQFCDTITFHENEFKIHGNGTVSIDKLMFSPGDFVARHSNGNIKYVQVCLNDYLTTYKAISEKYRIASAVHFGGKSRIIILFLLCAVIALKNL